MNKQIAKNCNILGDFCGKRDVPVLSPEALEKAFGIRQADVMVLFGGSILCGGDVLARAIKDRIAKKFVIVGGAGHTTQTLREKLQERFPDLDTANLMESELFDAYLKRQYNLEADLLERNSTNCGNNITFLLDLLKEHRVSFQSIVLCQDATMQRRMEAGLKKYVSEETAVISFASYAATVLPGDSGLVFQEEIPGMWEMDRYISLLMGEIPRLTDDENGYGPKGKNFISHVEIPAEVKSAFIQLQACCAGVIRKANPQFATK